MFNLSATIRSAVYIGFDVRFGAFASKTTAIVIIVVYMSVFQINVPETRTIACERDAARRCAVWFCVSCVCDSCVRCECRRNPGRSGLHFHTVCAILFGIGCTLGCAPVFVHKLFRTRIAITLGLGMVFVRKVLCSGREGIYLCCRRCFDYGCAGGAIFYRFDMVFGYGFG